MKRERRLPPVGLRIVKSAVAVALCFLVAFARGGSGIVFYSHIAALWCIQMYTVNTWKNAKQRFLGTVIGALYGLLFLLLRAKLSVGGQPALYLDAAVIALMIVLVLYTTVLIKKKQASYFSCVVFLSIVVNHIGDADPYLFVWNRFLDTVIGIAIGVLVNSFSLPRKKQRDVLFISGLDGILLDHNHRLGDYNRVELNRMLDEGANFTISTVLTPAAVMEATKDVRLALPVIAMDGAALYDIRENCYLKVYVISSATSQQVLGLIHDEGLCCFTNVIIDDLLIIYYDKLEDGIQKRLVEELRRSPYRNYVQRPVPESERVVYFMLLYPKAVIDSFYEKLKAAGLLEELKVLAYDSVDYPGYAYIKIFNRNATKENMIAQLKESTGLTKAVTFGTVPGAYDVVVDTGDINSVVHTLKRLYEPLWMPKKKG
ncbi:MAG: FUSC family protein [Muribaculaceae bacterium]|nr:FUSC family protein [Roseburia sp.]MCM1429813.1 FUSC family protein [Muribaculaceae bacterium]MCM1492864.1 FUSC family protein [Muribaculaceae bacterium]